MLGAVALIKHAETDRPQKGLPLIAAPCRPGSRGWRSCRRPPPPPWPRGSICSSARTCSIPPLFHPRNLGLGKPRAISTSLERSASIALRSASSASAAPAARESPRRSPAARNSPNSSLTYLSGSDRRHLRFEHLEMLSALPCPCVSRGRICHRGLFKSGKSVGPGAPPPSAETFCSLPENSANRWHGPVKELIDLFDEAVPDAVSRSKHRLQPGPIEAATWRSSCKLGAQAGLAEAAVRPARRNRVTRVRVALPARARIWRRSRMKWHRDRVETVPPAALLPSIGGPTNPEQDRWTPLETKSIRPRISSSSCHRSTGLPSIIAPSSSGRAGAACKPRQVGHLAVEQLARSA